MNVTALALCVNVPLLMKSPPTCRSPPAAVESANVVEAEIVSVPRKRRYCADAPKLTLVEAVEMVTLNGTPCPLAALAVHSVPAANAAPVLYVNVEEAP